MVDITKHWEFRPDHKFEEFEAEFHDAKFYVVRTTISKK